MADVTSSPSVADKACRLLHSAVCTSRLTFSHVPVNLLSWLTHLRVEITRGGSCCQDNDPCHGDHVDDGAWNGPSYRQTDVLKLLLFAPHPE